MSVIGLVKTVQFQLLRRKTLISNRGRWSPLSLFRQVHLGVGKSENNLPSQGYEATSCFNLGSSRLLRQSPTD